MGGIVQSITLETDPTTGITIVSLDIVTSDETPQSLRLSLETAISLGLVVLSGDGTPGINPQMLGKPVEISPADVIPMREENLHPVGNALATFFADIEGVDYETIMSMHEQGTGFGVIAQSLWLTRKLEGDSETFEAIIESKQTGDYSAFVLSDGTIPQNWGQLRKAILDKNNQLTFIPADKGGNQNGNGNGNPGGNGNGNGGGNGNGNGNGGGSNNGGGNGNGNPGGNGNGGGNGNDNGGGNGNDKER